MDTGRAGRTWGSSGFLSFGPSLHLPLLNFRAEEGEASNQPRFRFRLWLAASLSFSGTIPISFSVFLASASVQW